MNLISGTMLLALTATHGKSKALLHLLSPSEKEGVDRVAIPEHVDYQKLTSNTAWIKEIHYSWFVPFLSQLPEESAALFISFFDPKEGQKLAEMMNVPKKSFQLSPLGLQFLHHLLKEKIWEKDLLPETLLPPSPLNPLLHLNKEELTHLIDLLGIYDLAAELRHVVDKQLIQSIHSALTPVQMQFLQYATKQPMKWIPPKMNLEGWDKEKKTLFALLHKRGLYRLGKAMLLEEKSLRWHLVHRLDTGRGEYLMKLFAGKEDPAMITYFKAQVLHLLKRHL